MGGSLGFFVQTLFSVFAGLLFLPSLILSALKHCFLVVLIVGLMCSVAGFYVYMFVQLVS